MDAKALIIMGRFGAPFGIKGEVKVNSFSDPVDALIDYQPWFYETDSGFEEVPLESARLHKSQIIVARLADCEDRDEAKRWTHKTIAVARDALPELEDDEYYWNDLEGVSVFTGDGQKLGIISRLFATGANDVMVIDGEEQHFVPFILDKVVQKIDLDKKRMIIDWDIAK